MATVFGRPMGNHSPLANLIDTTLSTPNPDPLEAVFAQNLRIDHRISVARGGAFEAAHVSKAIEDEEAQPLSVALKRCKTESNRLRTLAHFRDPDLNADNILLDGRSPDVAAIPPVREFVRLINVTSECRRVAWARHVPGRRKEFEDKFGAEIPSNFTDVKKVNEWIEGWKKENPRQFIEAFFELVNRHYRAGAPYEPQWATTLKAFEEARSTPPCRPWERLGLQLKNDCWLVAVAYESAHPSTVARPTQLDAGGFEFHFPSPPNRIVTEGGLTMNASLEPNCKLAPLPEYVHTHVDLDPAMWDALEFFERAKKQDVMLTRSRYCHERARGATSKPRRCEVPEGGP